MGTQDESAVGRAPDHELEERAELRPPRLYRVVLHNDHYTTMEFVVDVLVGVFHKPAREAQRIMLDVHRRGSGVCGVYSYDVARTKVARVLALAREHEFPLKCTYEEA
jgi:ATP-dependent Clp protease adaptor protein ClpS